VKPKTKAGALEVVNIKWKNETGSPVKIKIQTKLTNEIVQ
jgi:hypothetical protein